MQQFLIGLTGGIGSGKSAAAERFSHHDIRVVDADLASRVVVEPGQPALTKIADHFGAGILLQDGQLDRAALRQRVFAEPAERQWLQQLLHPLISRYLREHIGQAASPYVVLVNPLLVESQQHTWCTRILVIDVDESLQVSRTMARDQNTREQVENIMQAQASRTQRLALADDVIVNDQDLDQLHIAVDELHHTYLQLAAQAKKVS
ncbi:MAG: dephospho-CoA kinase [Pseudomonadota bacterium]